MSAALGRGWLVAWALWSGVPAGALVLLMIHAVTGGRWGGALAPVLRPLAGLMPLAALGFLGVAAALPAIYPWAADPAAAAPGVAARYLNPAFFLGRAAVALLGWSVLGVLAAADRLSPLAAGLGLAFYGLTISLVSVDWLLSVEPRHTSSAFAAGIAFQEMLSALAVAAVASPTTLDERGAKDLAGLLVATLLAVLYVGLMAFIVAWYGDLPSKAAWYGRRGGPLWAGVIGTAVALGLVAFGLLLLAGVRRSPGALRLVGVPVLAGIAGHLAWLVLPAPGTPLAGALAAAGLGLAVLAVLSSLALRFVPGPRPAEAARAG